MTCGCGNVYMDDSLFCRLCGDKRDESPPRRARLCRCGNAYLDDSTYCRVCGIPRDPSDPSADAVALAVEHVCSPPEEGPTQQETPNATVTSGDPPEVPEQREEFGLGLGRGGHPKRAWRPSHAYLPAGTASPVEEGRKVDEAIQTAADKAVAEVIPEPPAEVQPLAAEHGWRRIAATQPASETPPDV